MKFVYSILVASLLLFAGCKQDLQVTVTHYVDTPVVYGLLNLNETYPAGPNAHYIRIQKGYLLKGNAYLATGIEDSIYYPNNLTVQLNSADGYHYYNLTRIDGATVGLNKDTGIFANVPNYLYTFTGNLNIDSTTNYNLLITRNDTSVKNGVTVITIDTVATSTTSLVNGLAIFYPSNNGTSTISFSNVPDQEATVSWGVGNNSGVYDLTVRFFYKEFLASTNTLTKDSFIDIPVFSSYTPATVSNGTATYNLAASVITNYLANNLANNNLLYREFVSMQFTIGAGGTTLASYFNQQQSQSGLTSSNALPPFTNITGGVGLLSSREYQSVSNIGLSNMGLDSLACAPGASFLNFKNSSGNVCN
jgi:hypothetical protein